jgi:arginine repressor
LAKYKENRLKILKDFLRKHEGKKLTQVQIAQHLESKGFSAAQGAISKDIRELGFKREKKKGAYVRKDSTIKEEKEDILGKLILSENPYFRFTHVPFFIKTTIGNEGALCDLIWQVKKEDILGVFPGRGCVMVVCENKIRAKRTFLELKSFRSEIVTNETNDIKE